MTAGDPTDFPQPAMTVTHNVACCISAEAVQELRDRAERAEARLAKAVEKMCFRLEATERERWGSSYAESLRRSVASNIREDLAELEAEP